MSLVELTVVPQGCRISWASWGNHGQIGWLDLRKDTRSIFGHQCGGGVFFGVFLQLRRIQRKQNKGVLWGETFGQYAMALHSLLLCHQIGGGPRFWSPVVVFFDFWRWCAVLSLSPLPSFFFSSSLIFSFVFSTCILFRFLLLLFLFLLVLLVLFYPYPFLFYLLWYVILSPYSLFFLSLLVSLLATNGK